MSEQSQFLSEMLAGVILQDQTKLPDLLRSVQTLDLDPPYGAVVSTVARMTHDGPLDPWALQQAVASVSPGLPSNFIGDLAAKGVTAAFEMYLSQFREGVARRRLQGLAEIVGGAARTEDLRLGIARVREALEDAEQVLQPQVLPLLDGDLLWGYKAPLDSVLLPGLMWRQSRAILTGFEGSGKSVILRQMALAGALGLHPFKPHAKVEPIRTLMLDLENPPAIAQTVMRTMLDTLKERGHVPTVASFEDRMKYQIRTDGLDIVGKGRDRDFVANAVATHRPDLLCVGPAYRLAAAGGNLDEERAGVVLDFLNHLRATYDVAIITEAHAPKGATDERDSNNRRSLTPSGSGVWMRFPEVGRGLRFDKTASDKVGRTTFKFEAWRGDRAPGMHFPNYLSRGVRGQVWWDDTSEEVESQLN